MKEPMVITMAREYASGGSEIAQAVADKLGIPLYNKELIPLAAKKSGLTEEAIAASENQRSGSLIYSLYMMGNTMPLADQVYILQSNVIKELASQGPCVILGRCGDYVLRERPNVLRTFGKGAAALTIVGDIGKGILAVLLAKWAFGAFTAADPIYGAYIAAFCAVLGHVYPVYFGFKGGKAVSVATGTIIAIKPVLILPLLAVFFIVFLCSKMVSLASICCAGAYPAVTFLYFHFVAGRDVVLTTCCAAFIGGLVIWLHRSNIQRIKNGTEYKFGRKKK